MNAPHRHVLPLVLLLGALLAAGTAWAGEAPFPNRTIRVIVGVPAGGNLDINTRTVADRMATDLGQPVVVENRPSASALVATQFVAKAPADGYTILAMSNTFTAVPAMLRNPGWEVRNFTSLGMYARVPLTLVVASGSPLRSVQDLLARAKQRPGEVSSGTGGDGSAGDIATTLLAIASDTRLLKVPYKGGSAPALVDLMGGRIDMVFDPVSTSAPQVKGGRLRAIGVTSRTRSALLPDVPTLAESGLGDYSYEVFNGLLLPAGTPKEVVARLHAALARALADPGVKDSLLKAGVEVPADDTPEKFWAFVDAEVNRYRKLVKEGYLKPE